MMKEFKDAFFHCLYLLTKLAKKKFLFFKYMYTLSLKGYGFIRCYFIKIYTFL